jgi:hypothetical protein
LYGGLSPGEVFSSVVHCGFGDLARILSFCALDEYGYVSSYVSFTGIALSDGHSGEIGCSSDLLRSDAVNGSMNPFSVPARKLETEVAKSGSVTTMVKSEVELSSHAATFGDAALIAVRAGVPSGSTGNNFDIWGLSGSAKILITHSSKGFGTRMRIFGQTSASAVGLKPMAHYGVNLATSVVQLTDYAGLIRFRLQNGNSVRTIVDLECDGDTFIDGLGQGYFYDNGGVGFTMNGTNYWFTCLCRSCPLVRNVSTYWIGTSTSLSTTCWTQSTVSLHT